MRTGSADMATPVGSTLRMEGVGVRLREDEQGRAGFLTGWPGGLLAARGSGPGDEEADPAVALLVLDRLGGGDVGQPGGRARTRGRTA